MKQNVFWKEYPGRIEVILPEFKKDYWKTTFDFLKRVGFPVNFVNFFSLEAKEKSFLVGDLSVIVQWWDDICCKFPANYLISLKAQGVRVFCLEEKEEREKLDFFYQNFPPPKNLFLNYPVDMCQLRDWLAQRLED